MDYKAFVSSTFVDLKDHRTHVIRELRKSGFFVDPMEDWTSSANEPKEFSRQRLEGCHLCVLLIARRRGYVAEAEQLSITQMEFDEAKRRKIDILPFLLDDSVDEGAWPWEEEDVVKSWRAEVFEHFGVETFKRTPSTLKIGPAVLRWIQEKGPQVALRLYLENVRHEHGTIKFVSLPKLEDNADAPIQQLFVEPAISNRWISPESDPKEWPKTTPVLDMPQKLVLLGDPGSGKSTLVNWIAWQLASEHGQNLWTERLGKLVPLPMILRELGVGVGITWEGLLKSFMAQPPYSVLTMANLEQILTEGRAMIMLDGLDEIGSPQVRRDLQDAVRVGGENYENCCWLLTSRIVGYEDVPFHVRHLYPPFAEDLAHVRYVAPFDDTRVSQFANNWFVLRDTSEHKAKRGAEELLTAIRANEGTNKLGRIPNLLTMMALIWRIEAHLPNGRALLCHKIAEAYLYTIDRWKRIDLRPERLEDRRRWLARIGFEMQRRRSTNGKGEKEIFASGADVRGWIAAAMMESGREAGDAEAAQFVDYLGRRTGLLQERGEDRFAFLHLSFQEYFAAWYLKEKIVTPEWLEDEQADLAPGTSKQSLAEYATQPVWRETLVFLVELLAAEQPSWLNQLRRCLFGEEYAFLSPTDQEDENAEQTVLLARLTIDRQAGFSNEQNWRAITACCVWELQQQKKLGETPAKGNRETLRVLLSCEPPAERQRILELVAELAFKWEMDALGLMNTPISDLTPLAKLRNLKVLDLQNTSVWDLSPIVGLENLQWLGLDGTPVLDLTSLESLRKLQTLDLRETAVLNLMPLTGLGSLEYLYLKSSPVSDLTPLADLENLRMLELDGTSVSDLTPLCGLTSLQTLYLCSTPVSDLSPLLGLKALQRIVVFHDQQVTVPKELESCVMRVHRVISFPEASFREVSQGWD